MSKKLEYIVINGYGVTLPEAQSRLESSVNHKISCGWEPLGGVCCVQCSDCDRSFAYQAMIKKGSEDE